jgi:hypothetical protein
MLHYCEGESLRLPLGLPYISVDITYYHKSLLGMLPVFRYNAPARCRPKER